MAFASLSAVLAFADSKSQVVDRELTSRNFAENKIGVSPVRKMVVYLPADYDATQARYPVIYYFPDAAEGYRALFAGHGAQALFDQASAAGVIGRFIFVSVDMNTPLAFSWCLNSPVTGNWEDFVIQELVPYIDANFKTLPGRDSRGIAGDRMGGYGAIRIAMRHPEVFGSVYGMHPVGTGSGVQTMYSRPNWELLANAKSLEDLKGDVFSTIFTGIFEAFLPDPDKPPLFTDLPARKVGNELIVDSMLTEKLRENFLLESQIAEYADNLRSLRGFKFDWGRGDTNQDHVYSNQAFTHKLNEFGIPHEAEEYNGGWGDKNWGEEGRVYSDVLPFFGKHLVF
jgi:enterochelin esterase-like enzyme